MTIIKSTNLILRFLLELAALAALAVWGFQTPANTLLKILLAITLPLIAALLWGLFVSPKAKYRLPEIGRLALEITLFASAVFALHSTNHPTLAATFALLALIHLPLTFLFNQRHQ
jgi:hypothetical protein